MSGRPILVLSLLALAAGGTAMVFFIVDPRPSFDAVMRDCLATEAQAPAQDRAATCICVVQEHRSYVTSSYLAVLP